MAKKHLFLSFFLTAMLCIVGVGNAWGATYNYHGAFNSCVISESIVDGQTQFTLTMGLKAKNTANGTTYSPSTLTLILLSTDGTLEGEYSTADNNNKISSETNIVYNEGTPRPIYSAQTSSITIEKISTPSCCYRITSGEFHLTVSSNYYNYTFCYGIDGDNVDDSYTSNYDFGYVKYAIIGTAPNKTLTISGWGPMNDFTSGTAPWYSERSNIKTIVISDGVTYVGAYAFQGITYSSITIPVSVTGFGNRAFYGISSGSTKNVYYKGTPNEWAQIDFAMPASYASSHPFYQSSDDASYSTSNHIYFYNQKTTETTKIVFTPGIEEIKPYVFWHAGNITNVNIPHSVTSIGKKAFWKCSNLCRIYINNTNAPTTGTDVFSGIRYNSTLNNSSWLYLPAGASASTSAPGYRRAPWYDSENTGNGASCIGYYSTDKSKSSTGNNFSSYITNSKVYPTSGTVDGISWRLDANGVMTFSGSGAITTEFSTGTGSDVVYPWLRFCELTDKVVIKGEVTGLSNALANFTALREITIAQATIPTASSSLPTYIHGQKVQVYIDNSSEGDATLSTAPWNNSKFQKSYTTTFCGEPTDLTASSIGTTSATFTWTDDRGDTWKYVCLPASTTITSSHWASAASTNTTSATVSGLNIGKSYTFYVRSDCGSSSSSAINVIFNTECVSIAHASLPWSENFDDCASGLTPACWTQLKTSSGFAQATSLEYRGSDGNSLRIAGGTSSSTGLAVFPQFADDIKNLELTFYYRSNLDEYGETYGQAQIGYITNIANISTFVAVQTLDKAGYWTKVDKFMVPANTPDGAYFAIRFYGNGNTLGFAHIDDIVVSAKPECVAPTNVAVSGISNDGATIGWDDNDMTAWVLQVSEGDDEHWGEDINVNSDSKALTGLNDNTLYYVRVKADCGVYGDSDWSDAVSFRTECDAIDVDASTPWSENFNAMDEYIVPECWNNSASTAIPHNSYSYYIWGTYNAGSSNKMLRMSNASVDGGVALINTPAFAIPDDGKEYEFMFDYANHASSDLIVKMSVDGSAFGVVNTYHNTGSNSTNPGELTSETISLYGYNGSTVKLQFYTEPASGYSSADGAIFVDNVGVRKVPSCFQPTALAASNISANSAHIAWTAGASETSWKLQYRESGDEWSEEITVNTTAAKDLESLSANTTYEVRVKAWCNIDDFSEWSETAEFTTLCAAESMPYSEAFGVTTSLPTCWKASSDNWSGDYQSTNGFARLRTGSSGTASLCTPPVDLSEDAILRFKWKNANGTAVNLYISTDRGETKTLITDELSDVQADWTTKQYNLSAYTGEEAQFYFIATFSTQNQYAYLDDVEVFAIPTEVFEDVASAPNNETRLAALNGQTINMTIERPLLRNGDYCTLCLPFDLSAAQIADENCPLHGFTIKEFARAESGESVNIYLNEVSEIEAGKPYFVRYAGTPTNERLTPLIFRNVTITAYQPSTEKLSDDCSPYAVFNPYALVANDQSTLFLSSNNTLYYPSANGTMNGFRAYLKVDTGGALSAPIRRGAPIRIVEQENTATGVDNGEWTNGEWRKVIREGQLIIIRDGKEYNAQGQLMK